MQEQETKIVLNSSSKAGEYFVSLLGGIKDKEKFLTVFLDSGNNIIETRTMSEGSIGEAVVYPRMLLKAALDCDCKSIILAHNHPGGSLSPSMQDKDLTQKLVSIFEPLQISVIDHIIVANIHYHSMAESGNLPQSSPLRVNYDAVPLSDQKELKEEIMDFHADMSNEEDVDLDNIDFPEQDGEEEDEWDR